MSSVDNAIASPRVVLSVMGPHAGEGENAIFTRKRADIASCGSTLWLCCSPAARPDRTQDFRPEFVLFLDPASPRGARPTTTDTHATLLSLDRVRWESISPDLGPVTGRMSNAYAFVLSSIELCDNTIDLWSYADATRAPIRFRLGASTLLAQKTDMVLGGVASRFRRVRAVATLTHPYAVWVR